VHWLHFTSLSSTILLIGVEGLQRAFCHSQCWAIVLTLFHSIPFKIPYVLAFQTILGCLILIPKACPNHLRCANYFFSLKGVICNPILIVWLLILSLLVFSSIYPKCLIFGGLQLTVMFGIQRPWFVTVLFINECTSDCLLLLNQGPEHMPRCTATLRLIVQPC
jgi:hypothetical protein